MIPISDENPTLRTPVMTYLLLAAMLAAWVLVEGAGTNAGQLAAAVCNYGLVPAELTHGRPVPFTEALEQAQVHAAGALSRERKEIVPVAEGVERLADEQ